MWRRCNGAAERCGYSGPPTNKLRPHETTASDCYGLSPLISRRGFENSRSCSVFANGISSKPSALLAMPSETRLSADHQRAGRTWCARAAEPKTGRDCTAGYTPRMVSQFDLFGREAPDFDPTFSAL